MKIFINEREFDVSETSSVSDLRAAHYPRADVIIQNGFPANPDDPVREGDRLVFIRKGEVPPPEELESLMSARHTPGVHARLKRASVGIAGCGGLGSNAATALARVGIGHLVLVDFDVVEPSNLNRQAYFIDQIGLPKVQALKANLKRINPAVRIDAHDCLLTPQNISALLGSVDVIVEAFDRADQKSMLGETCAGLLPDKPIVMGVGMAGYGSNPLLHTRVMGNLHVVGDECSEASPGMGLMAPRVMAVAAMQANQVLEILLGPDPRILEAAKRRS